MAMLKKYWRIIAFSLTCLVSLGAGGWAYMEGDSVQQRMEQIDRLRGEVESARRSPVNRGIIEARKKEIAEANARFEQAMSAALTLQKQNAFESKADDSGKLVNAARAPLVKDALPKPLSSSDALDFRDAYKKAHAQLTLRLKGRGKATIAEIADYQARMQQLKVRPPANSSNPWGPGAAGAADDSSSSASSKGLAELLVDYSRARATEEIATGINCWVDDRAFGRHILAESEDAPKDEAIWQAQMSLWIQQDIAHGLARANENRIAKLREEKHEDRCWVAYLPLKRLIAVRIADRLGRGGGSNVPRDDFALSFTGLDNTSSMFVVPIAIDMVVEESRMMEVVSSICSVGFYTVTSITYKTVRPNPFQDEYIYGEDPVVEMRVDMEAYYFRKVFDPWIPKDLKPILATPGAVDESATAGGGRG
jgi:hypothetical protein